MKERKGLWVQECTDVYQLSTESEKRKKTKLPQENDEKAS